MEYPERLSKTRFPVNRLRNLASQQCQSPYALLHDIDFTVHPRPTKKHFSDLKTLFSNQTRRAVVLPAFTLKGNAKAHPPLDLLEDKAGLKTLLERDKAAPFNMFHLPETGKPLSGFYPAHGPTDFLRWFQEEAFYMIRSQTSKFPYYFEPYVLMRTADLISFDESFVFYGFNKVSFLHELAALGTEFFVHPELFVVHTFDHESDLHLSPEDVDLPCVGDEKKQFFKPSLGHSCIGYFLRRLHCAYGFSMQSLEFSPARTFEHAQELYTDNTTVIPCLPKCIYDVEQSLREQRNVRRFSLGCYRGEETYQPPTRSPCRKWNNL